MAERLPLVGAAFVALFALLIVGALIEAIIKAIAYIIKHW